MFLLVLAHPGSPGQRAVKRLLLLLFIILLIVTSSHQRCAVQSVLLAYFDPQKFAAVIASFCSHLKILLS